ncbi:MAG: hypothetical protein ACI4CS_03320 [Candidatus Weimeria sp.]
MNLLREKAISIGKSPFCSAEERDSALERHSLIVKLWNESMLDHWENAGDLVSLYQMRFLSNLSADIQLISFFELMHYYHTCDSFNGLSLLNAAVDVLRITRPQFSAERCLVNFLPSYIEFLILNAIACGMFESNQELLYRRAILLVGDLIRVASQKKDCLSSGNLMAPLMINLCFFEACHEDLSEAGRHFEMIPAFFTISGGIYLYCKSLRCGYFFYKKCGMNEKCEETLSTIREMLKKIPAPPSVSSFMKNSPKIMVF